VQKAPQISFSTNPGLTHPGRWFPKVSTHWLQTELKPEKMFAGILQRERMEREKEARIIHDHLTDFRFLKFEIV